MGVLKQELVKELRQKEVNPPKDSIDETVMSRDFMIYLFRILYTYQTIGKEILKESIFEKRIELLKEENMAEYADLLDSRQRGF
jgi:hypothetical protein